MKLNTYSQAPGKNSLPAEIQAAQTHGTPAFALSRLHRNMDRMQAHGGVVPPGLQRHFGSGVSGLGDYGCVVGGIDPLTGDTIADCASGTYGDTSGTTVVPAGSPGFDWTGLTQVINAGSTDIAKILAASNPGTMYRDPQGNVIYSQPTGNTQNLPIGGGYGGQGTFTGPLGTSGSFSGISTNTILVVAVIGLAFMMMGSKR